MNANSVDPETSAMPSAGGLTGRDLQRMLGRMQQFLDSLRYHLRQWDWKFGLAVLLLIAAYFAAKKFL